MEDRARAAFSSGHLVMAEETMIIAIVTVIQIQSGHYQYQVPRRMVSFLGTVKPAAASWQQLTAPVAVERGRLPPLIFTTVARQVECRSINFSCSKMIIIYLRPTYLTNELFALCKYK